MHDLELGRRVDSLGSKTRPRQFSTRRSPASLYESANGPLATQVPPRRLIHSARLLALLHLQRPDGAKHILARDRPGPYDPPIDRNLVAGHSLYSLSRDVFDIRCGTQSAHRFSVNVTYS